jgi:hypothetical protein
MRTVLQQLMLLVVFEDTTEGYPRHSMTSARLHGFTDPQWTAEHQKVAQKLRAEEVRQNYEKNTNDELRGKHTWCRFCGSWNIHNSMRLHHVSISAWRLMT